MPSHLRFDEDGLDTYEPSDSEDEYTEKERQLLKKVRNRKKEYSDSEDEVLGVGPDGDEDDDDKSDLALSDVEGQDDNDSLPDVRAWGKDKKRYYSTDYVDPDYGGFQGKDAHLAELEEEEARNLQKQLAQQLDDDDFSLDIFIKKTDEDKTETEEIIKTDISKLSKRQKLHILRKESPEFFGLVEDFEAKMVIARDYLNPTLQKYKKGQIPDCRAVEFVQTQYELILNYCTNIHMYLVLKSSRVNIQNHPVIKRLYQYRQLLSQLEPVYVEVIKPQIDIMLQETENSGEEPGKDKKHKLKFLTALTEASLKSVKKKKHVGVVEDERPTKKMRVDENVADGNTKGVKNKETPVGLDDAMSDSSASEEEQDETNEIPPNDEENETNKRPITYKMAKNKGLTPHKKKEFRNPRVKHRIKYRKAVIRRKGAVREPRRELSRYSGEISGIKTSVSKSIKIKT